MSRKKTLERWLIFNQIQKNNNQDFKNSIENARKDYVGSKKQARTDYSQGAVLGFYGEPLSELSLDLSGLDADLSGATDARKKKRKSILGGLSGDE